MRRRRGAIIAAIVVLAIAALVSWQLWFGLGPRLRREADRFGTPTGMSLIDRGSAGSSSCFISCDNPRLTLVFKTSRSAKASCDELLRHLRKRGYERRDVPAYVSPPGERRCFYQAPARRIREGALVSAMVVPAGSVGGSYFTYGASAEVVPYSDLVAVVQFDSQLD